MAERHAGAQTSAGTSIERLSDFVPVQQLGAMEFSFVMEQPTDPDSLVDVRIAPPAHDRNAALSPFLQGSDEGKMGNA